MHASLTWQRHHEASGHLPGLQLDRVRGTFAYSCASPFELGKASVRIHSVPIHVNLG
jgi:hypothetical protein